MAMVLVVAVLLVVLVLGFCAVVGLALEHVEAGQDDHDPERAAREAAWEMGEATESPLDHAELLEEEPQG